MPKKINSTNLKEYLLVYVDESEEFLEAMKYACELARTESLGIMLLYIVQDENFRHWKGVENIMREEQKNEAKEVLGKYIKYIKDNYKLHVKSYIKTGDKLDVLIKALNGKRPKIKNLVLGLAMDKIENNKVISSLTGILRKKLTLPIIIVPGKIK
ncbi:MAG: hypothetical protein CMP38_06870 [Rickettsiales bacterium]|nr:hypothetical protein [Rickettsiales bacterium]OUV99344.1 MAG: hypothetical protein CBD16_08350 [Betaproteobacteria bacterium TMED156]